MVDSINCSVGLGYEDVARAERLSIRHGFNKAQAVVESLALADLISEKVNNQGAMVILQYPNGEREKVIQPALGLS